MGVWNTATPAGSDDLKDGHTRIRELKTAIQEALRGGAADGDEALFPGSAPLTAPVFHYRGLKGATAAKPAAGAYGLYYDSDRGMLCRDNGSTWDDIATLGSKVIPAATKAIFYQAAAPTGWTRDTTAALNDKFLRIVTAGSPGTTGGGWGTLSHDHNLSSSAWACLKFSITSNRLYIQKRLVSQTFTRDGYDTSSDSLWSYTASSASVTGGGIELAGATDAEALTHGSAQHAYCDALIAAKDAY